MNHETTTIEGKWEDVIKKASRFKGRRVRITVVPQRKYGTAAAKRAKPVDEETARMIKKYAGCWAGDDLDECLDFVTKTRLEAEW
ncbi:MAG: hypothetical protein NTX50_19415 [Candidatus Sumerlaeota bacterium]|nr:hypothetical protein [Candidatus Sumerlaeota bacterium]